MRCPNAACRKVFAVPPDDPEEARPAAPAPRPSPQSGSGQRSGTVGDLVPILPAEPASSSQESSEKSKYVTDVLPLAPVSPVTGEQPVEGNWWQAAPPVRSKAGPGNERQPPESPSDTPPSHGPPSDEAWWQDAPPVSQPPKPIKTVQAPTSTSSPPPTRHRRSVRSAAETQPMPVVLPTPPPSPKDEGKGHPRELPPGAWEPPPVRRAAENVGQLAQEKESPATEDAHTEFEYDNQPPVNKRRVKLALAALLLIPVVVFIPVGWWAWQKFHLSEEALSAEAREDYRQGSFSSAESKFRLLAQKFPTSDHAEEYRFLTDWSAVCGAASNPETDLSEAASQLDQFIKNHKKDALMKQFGRDAGQRLLHLAKTVAERNASPTDEGPLKIVERIDQLRFTVAALRADALSAQDSAQIEAALGQVRRAVELACKRRDLLAQLRKRDGETWMDALKRARSLLAQMERELPGISQDGEAKSALAQLEEGHLASVVYQEAKDAPHPPPQLPEESAKVLPFAPLLPPAALGSAPANDPIVLALARGLLYALKQSNGELKWAVHVGIDTTVLPRRVPASAISPELLLVLSADTQTLSALNTQGDTVWEYAIGQPVLGRPVIIEQRAYLADYAGWIHEIELSRGQLVGRWFLGQPLTCGGAREGNTSRIYFPADDSCIYVLDVKARRCVTILYDGHPSGSLRSEPIIIPPEGDTAPGYLILNQASGLDATELRVFELPLLDRHVNPWPLDPPARFPGWTWFEPKTDGEKLAVLSDAGYLGLFGIRQRGNQDPALFPWLQTAGLDLSSFLQLPAPEKGTPGRARPLMRERGRAQVVHMEGYDLWVLANGRFQQLHLRLDPMLGPQVVPHWQSPLPLGSPLHESQPIEEGNGRSSFFLVTQALEQQTCLATRVNEEGQILWQRQLGLVCQSEPVALASPIGGPPLLLALDQGGGLFVLDPTQPNKPRLLAPALSDNPLFPPRLLVAADGRSAYEIAAPGDGQWLIVRHIDWVGGERTLQFLERKVSLVDVATIGDEAMTPAGPPVVTSSYLLIPMTDGRVKGLSLAELLTEEQPRPQTGPTWRDRRQPPVLAPYILDLGNDRFLTTDGNSRLSVWEWPPGKDKIPQFLPKGGEPLALEHLMASPPVLLPAGKEQLPRVAVVDAAGFLRLFSVGSDGSLQPGLTWKLEGNLSAGPFVQAAPEGGWRIGCVLDRRRLLWIDPEKKETLWSYSSGGPAILGQPQRIENMLVLALQSGRYVGIDPNTGQPKGPGYTLRTSAAPAATPVSYGTGRMFAPLSDGTALLLSVELLHQKKP